MSLDRMPSIHLRTPHRLFRKAFLVLTALLAGPVLIGNEPPTRLQIEQYRRDGSLPARIRAARELENHRPDPILVQRAARRLALLADPEKASHDRPIPPGPTDMPTKGNVKIPVLLIDFSDYPHDEARNSLAAVQARIFGNGDSAAPFPYESLRNYYLRSSYNQLDLTGNVLGWYRPAYTRASIAQTTTGRQNLIKEALNHYNAQGHDFAQYDNNGDGRIDYLAVIWSGPNNGWSNFWWGYKTSWNDAATPMNLDGKTLGSYSWQWESNPVGSYFVPRTLIHETGHGLGLPDYYDYLSRADGDTIGPDGGVGGLDMMDGTWGDHNCFSKFLLDWIMPSVYTAATSGVSLRASGNFGDAAILMPDVTPGNNFGEFFMAQNRQRVQNDPAIWPADGLLVWHVDSRLNDSGTDFRYDNSWTEHKLLRLMEADGLEEIEQDLSADAGDYWTSGRTFGPQGIPNSSRYSGLWSWMGITSISAPGATMSFNVFTLPADTTPPTGVPSTPSIGGSPSTTGTLSFQWTAGTAGDPDSGITSYQLQVGTTPGAGDLFDGLLGNVTSRTFTRAGQDGASYYGRVRAMNGAGLFSGWSGSSPAIQVEYPTFPCAALDACGLVFKTRGDAPWTSQSAVTHGGASAAQSAAIGNQSDSVLQTTVAGPGTFSFWWKISSEAGYDFLTFSIDGVAQSGRISGETDWAQMAYTIPAGTHLLRWTYAKDEAVVEGQDRAWVDQVSYSGGGAAPTIASFTPGSGPVGSPVSISGNHFTGSTSVRFNSTSATFTVVTDTTITTSVPAGATSGPITVTNADGTGASASSFTVTPPSTITVAVSPKPATVLTGGQVVFTAVVTGTSNTAVTWSLSGGGSISSSTGATTTYTAPAAAGSATVTATSQASSSSSDSATIIIKTRDFNGDGSTDVLDLASFARAFGSTPSSSNWNAAADLDGDGDVDDTDLTLFLAGI